MRHLTLTEYRRVMSLEFISDIQQQSENSVAGYRKPSVVQPNLLN